MTTKEQVIDFFSTHGYYVVTNRGDQQTAVDALVQEGTLRRADSSWFALPIDNIYVHAAVDCQAKIPHTLRHVLPVERACFQNGEICNLTLKYEATGEKVNVLVRVRRQTASEVYDVEIIGGHQVLYVYLKDLSKTY